VLLRIVLNPLKKSLHGFKDGIDLSIGNNVIDVLSVVVPLGALLVDSDLVRDFFETFSDFFVVAFDRTPLINHSSGPFRKEFLWILWFLDWLGFADGVLDVVVKLVVDFTKRSFHDINGIGDLLDKVFYPFHEIEDLLFVLPFDGG